MPTYGYARVSTEGQDLEPQITALRAAGCSEIIEEKASGTDRTRPELAQLLGRLRRGDMLVVVRIDRLARSLAHLLTILDRLQTVGAHFRSLSDPIDTANPTGRLVIQVIGAIAEFERNLIAERTKAGLAVAKARGRKLGNPGLQAGDPEARSRLVAGQKRAHLAALLPGLDTWLPTVRRLRPAACWEAVTDAVNQVLPTTARRFTRDRLVRSVRRLVAEGLAEPGLLAPAAQRQSQRRSKSRPALDAVVRYLRNHRREARERGIAAASYRPPTLAQVTRHLEEDARLSPPSGGTWAPSSVKALVDRAVSAGLTEPKTASSAAAPRAVRRAPGSV
jgi:DNA invertase Pin-like site-specific DNA recombinase